MFYYFMLYHSSALEFITERYISIVYYYYYYYYYIGQHVEVGGAGAGGAGDGGAGAGWRGLQRNVVIVNIINGKMTHVLTCNYVKQCCN